MPSRALAQDSSTQQAKPIPDGPPPKATPIPDGSQPRQKSVPANPQPKAYPIPIVEKPSFFAYERPSEDPVGASDSLGSTYIPVDSFVYPLVLRLYSMGYLDTAFINMRPYTRRSLLHMLNATRDKVVADRNEEAEGILVSLQDYVSAEMPATGRARGTVYGVDTVYTRFIGIDGQTLRDSYHLGQTIANDYGRPYQSGFNNFTGFSTVNEMGIFSLYVRGEYQHAPSGAGYSQALSAQLSAIDTIPYSGYNLHQATIPTGPIPSTNTFALQEAALSVHLFGHEISGGKSDAWLGPAAGGALAWSNNAQDIYSFRINRVDPLHIPLLSDLTGPFRYDFFVGSLKGHTDPNSPWVHSEEFSFAPTPNVRIGFQRTVIWGGEGHEPITLHTFLRSVFNLNDTADNPSVKFSAQDPGARYSDFNFSWRLPFLSHYVTLYTDAISHDDVTPPSAPRRAAYRPGVYISQFPGLHKLDFRIEGVSTDTSTLRSLNGRFNYFETIQVQGYTNKGFIMGDWIGREAKGGQAWLTYHLSPNEWIQVEYLNKKTPKDFIPGGTTQNQFTVNVVKRLRKDIEMNAWLQYEGWKAPIYVPGNGLNKDTTVSFQFTWFPELHSGAAFPH
ncbi:capsule assembly Wzi family protein [Granulicella sp. 5B5]|uniref:capsule assembly Wzi family protein n=1 Tax=Granulicella sp. 5B5 TaxID=1617967 RepID=UPI0015F6FECB|nr:capsule assembly Wzi family protein [Granulicella sp. 5B5]QMV19106.1 capsule assembly Wzi family protein [Granulicella sp. 5B5]